MFDVRYSMFEIFDRRKDRFRLHHHPLPSAKWRIINHMMFVCRPVSEVMNVKLEDSLFLCAFHHALAQGRAADFRKQRDDVDPHSLHVSAATPKPKIYPLTGWRVTNEELQGETFL